MRKLLGFSIALVLMIAVTNCNNQGSQSNNNNGYNQAVTPAPQIPSTNCLFNNPNYPNSYYPAGYNNGYYPNNGYNNTYYNGYNNGYNNGYYPNNGYTNTYNNGYNNGYYPNNYPANYATMYGTQCGYNYSMYQPTFMSYPFDPQAAQRAYLSGFCGCQVGFRPVYNSYWGLGCIDGRFVSTSSYFVGFYWNSTNSQWVNISQVTTMPATNSSSCYMDALLACDPSNPYQTCGTGGVCMAINGTRIGICQYQNGYNWGTTGLNR